MRCTGCHSYIPEGLPAPVLCPACGSNQATKPTAAPIAAQVTTPVAAKPETVLTPTTPSQPGFANYFTIKTRLSFGPLNALTLIEDGSISFGPDGFSIIWDQGKGWEKITYRDLGPARLKNDSVVFTFREVESKLTLYPSSHPLWMAKMLAPIFGATRTRSIIFIELLEKVKNGLSAIEISSYQRKLQ